MGQPVYQAFPGTEYAADCEALQDGRLSVAPMITEIAGRRRPGGSTGELLDHTGRKMSVLFAFQH